jgi:hypothetical protein
MSTSTNYDRAVNLAREMGQRHARGDHNTAMDIQTCDTIDHLVGVMQYDDGRYALAWPTAILVLADTSARKAVR